MNEEIPIVTLVIAAGLSIYVGYEINHRRTKLRRIFNTFDKEESLIASALEMMVKTGELVPYVPQATV